MSSAALRAKISIADLKRAEGSRVSSVWVKRGAIVKPVSGVMRGSCATAVAVRTPASSLGAQGANAKRRATVLPLQIVAKRVTIKRVASAPAKRGVIVM